MASQKSKKSRKARKQRRQRSVQSQGTLRTQSPDSDLASLKPRPFPGELVEDMAVFSVAHRDTLAAERQQQALAVAESLECVYRGEFDQATQTLSGIARSSPFSDWRLFVRGLIAFYTGAVQEARRIWQRLDRSRRPAHIAATLLQGETGQPLDADANRPPAKLVDVVERLRVRRGAVEKARQIVAVRLRGKDNTFTAAQASMLFELLQDYGRIDAEFVSHFSQACVFASTHQNNLPLFEQLAQRVPGSRCDPRWNLLRSWYAAQYEGGSDAMSRSASKYLEEDLPRVTSLTKEVRDALASRLCMEVAGRIQADVADDIYFIRPRFTQATVEESISWLRRATELYPRNRAAHSGLVETLSRLLEESELSKQAAKSRRAELLAAQDAFVRAFPNETDVAYALLDAYFDGEELDKAQQILELLQDQRQEDPLGKALPWKLKLREAMHLCRRKSNVPAARQALQAADELWPTWLRRTWLPFLYAALELRAGNTEQYERLGQAAREAAGGADWVNDIRMFAALQGMRIPGAQLKPLRQKIDECARNLSDINAAELYQAGSFFWDLVRTGTRHSAYRLQAAKFGKELCRVFKERDPCDAEDTLWDTCDWLSHHRYWSSGYQLDIPRGLVQISRDHARMAAAIVKAVLDHKTLYFRTIDIREYTDTVEQASRTESDPFYRHRFTQIAKAARSKLAEFERRNFAYRSYDDYEDDEDDDDYEVGYFDDWSDDEPCNCPVCRAERERAAGNRDSDLDESDIGPWDGSDDDDDDDLFQDGPSAIIQKTLLRLGPGGAIELMELMRQAPQMPSEEFVERIQELFARHDLSALDTAEFFEELEEQSDQFFNAQDVKAEAKRELYDQRRQQAKRDRKRNRSRAKGRKKN